MRIDIVLDVICPWCFIGLSRLRQALALRPAITPEFGWHPFQLNPDMPAGGMARQDYLAMKFGGAHYAGRIHQAVAEAGATAGIRFAFERIRRTPNTRDAHRLVRHAAELGRADRLIDRLFEAYFLEGRDLGDRATLIAIAVEAGLDAPASRRFLDSGAGLADVLAEDRGVRRMGINAVPAYVLAGQYVIAGAQEPEFFLPLFDLVATNAPALA